jgi:hypothetical protein
LAYFLFFRFFFDFLITFLIFIRLIRDRYLLERVVVSCRLCSVDQTGCLYLAANTPSEGFLYELAPRKEQNPENPEEGKRVLAKWTEIHHAKHRNYTALQTFAVVRQFFTLF